MALRTAQYVVFSSNFAPLEGGGSVDPKLSDPKMPTGGRDPKLNLIRNFYEYSIGNKFSITGPR